MGQGQVGAIRVGVRSLHRVWVNSKLHISSAYFPRWVVSHSYELHTAHCSLSCNPWRSLSLLFSSGTGFQVVPAAKVGLLFDGFHEPSSGNLPLISPLGRRYLEPHLWVRFLGPPSWRSATSIIGFVLQYVTKLTNHLGATRPRRLTNTNTKHYTRYYSHSLQVQVQVQVQVQGSGLGLLTAEEFGSENRR